MCAVHSDETMHMDRSAGDVKPSLFLRWSFLKNHGQAKPQFDRDQKRKKNLVGNRESNEIFLLKKISHPDICFSICNLSCALSDAQSDVQQL